MRKKFHIILQALSTSWTPFYSLRVFYVVYVTVYDSLVCRTQMFHKNQLLVSKRAILYNLIKKNDSLPGFSHFKIAALVVRTLFFKLVHIFAKLNDVPDSARSWIVHKQTYLYKVSCSALCIQSMTLHTVHHY